MLESHKDLVTSVRQTSGKVRKLRTHLGCAKPRTRRQQREQQLHQRAHLAAQPGASSTDRAFMEARQSPSAPPVEISEEEGEERALAELGSTRLKVPGKIPTKKGG